MYAHMDVVPCPKETLGEWRCDPFSGTILADEMAGQKQQCVFGRGAIDDKGRVLAMLEANIWFCIWLGVSTTRLVS